MEGIGGKLWKISVAAYLIANGVIGLMANGLAGDFYTIYMKLFNQNTSTVKIFVILTCIIAFAAGIALLLELLNVEISFIDQLIFIIAIVWAVYIVLQIIVWIGNTNTMKFFPTLQGLAVQLMVFASLLIASKKFD